MGMKKILNISLIALTIALCFSSCEGYGEYYGENDFSIVYFAKDDVSRSVVMDEFDYIKVGCVLAGKISNDVDEWFTYEMVDSLVDTSMYTVLPESMYTVEDNDYKGQANTVLIAKGEMLGLMKITLKPEFFNEQLALDGKYALGFRVVEASTDSIGKSDHVVSFQYLSNAIGFYNHTGVALAAADTLVYTNDDKELTTIAPLGTNSVTSPVLRIGENNLTLELTVDDDNNIVVKSASTSAVALTEDGTGFFDRTNDHNIYLEYTFDADGNTYSAKDTLVFYKRVIDGLIETDTRFF